MVAVTDWVRPATPSPVQVICLTPIDQMQARVYITFVTCFTLQAASAAQEVYSELRNGLALTLSEVPLLGGRLVPEEGGRGRLQIQVDEGCGIRFPFRDLSDPTSEVSSRYSYGKLKGAHFPPSALDGKDLSPVDMVPTAPTPAVMEVQANFISGGLLLTTCVHHAALDALGVAKILKVWAMNTTFGNSISSPKVLSDMATDRTPLMKISTKADLKNTPEFRILNGTKEITVQERIGASISSPPKECSTFYFSPGKLAELKVLASSSNPSDPWVSTHDALCGLLWRRISLARCFNSNDGQTSQIQFACAIQGRQRLSPPLPDDYLGNVSFYCPVTMDIETLVSPSIPLYTVARTVRTALAKFDNARLRQTIAVIDSVSTISHLEITCYDDPERSLGLSSWADMGLYELDWGRELGRPDRVRVLKQPTTGGVGGGAIFPRLPDGGLEVILGIEEDSMKRLRADAEFLRFAEWRCT